MKPLQLLETKGPRLWVVQVPTRKLRWVSDKACAVDRMKTLSIVEFLHKDKYLDHPPSTEVTIKACSYCDAPLPAIAESEFETCSGCDRDTLGIDTRKIKLPLANKWQLLLATDFSTEHFDIPIDTDTYPHLDSYHRLIELTDGEGEVAPVWVAVVEVTELLGVETKGKANK